MPVHVRHPAYFRPLVVYPAEVRVLVEMAAHAVAPVEPAE